MVIGSIVEGVAKIIASYTGYKRGKAKEDDLAVRKKIMTEMEKCRNNLKNTLEYMHEQNKDENGKFNTDTVRKVLDEIDMLSNEIDISETGHHYPFYDPKKGIKEDDILKIVKFDKELLDECLTLTETTQEIQQKILQDEDIDLDYEFRHIRQSITNLRNQYKDRINYIKDIKTLNQ